MKPQQYKGIGIYAKQENTGGMNMLRVIYQALFYSKAIWVSRKITCVFFAVDQTIRHIETDSRHYKIAKQLIQYPNFSTPLNQILQGIVYEEK